MERFKAHASDGDQWFHDNIPCRQPREVGKRNGAIPRRPCQTGERGGGSGFAEVQLLALTQQETAKEKRCRHCYHNLFLDGERCILCGACADVCPYHCISMVSAARIDWNGDEGRNEGYAMILDEDDCARCGLCVRRCRTGAITMRRVELQGE